VTAHAAADRSAVGPSGVARGAIVLLRAYKRFVSPLLPRVCRFHPSCSEYAREAIELHGVARGSGLALWRIARCQPWGRGGFDPVPPARGSGRGR
jgi:putative membrane protein insertion efficiency factor